MLSLIHISEAALPERRVARVEAKGGEELGMVLGAAGGEHGEVALGKTLGGMLVHLSLIHI